jgi:hypothetical protein
MGTHIPIYVPEAHYREMLNRLVSLMTEAQVEPPISAEAHMESQMPPVSQAAASAQSGRLWSEDEWQKVWPAWRDDTRELLVVIAEHPEEWVSITALEDSLGSFRAVQSALSSLTKRMKKHGLTLWPFEFVKDDGTGRFAYKMDEATATIVLGLAHAA